MAVITISRQSGSEGNTVIRLLCERLGYRYFDKTFMTQMAAEIGLRPEQVVDASAEEHHVKGIMERFFGSFQMPFGDPGVWSYSVLDEAREAVSVAHVRTMILAAYEQGNVVVVGRGGQIVLANKPDVLHVRVVAPIKTRIARWQARDGLSVEEARERVNERDQAHMDFLRRFFNADLNDPSLYDLVVSTGKMTPPAAVDLIIRALESLPE